MARCICIFILAVEIGLAGKVLFWVIHCLENRIGQLLESQGDFPSRGYLGAAAHPVDSCYGGFPE